MLIPDPDLHALIAGETVVAFTPRNTVDEGDEVALQPAGPRPPHELKPAYRHWAEAGPGPEGWTALVEAVQPAGSLAGPAGNLYHILESVPPGDVVVLRVFGDNGPVLADEEFARRARAIEAAFE